MEQLISFLNLVCTNEGWQLSEKCRLWLETVIKTKEVEKNDYVLSFGEVNRNLYFIESGLLKCYYTVGGKKVCDWFFGEQEFVVGVDSFYDQRPSEDFIQALEPCG